MLPLYSSWRFRKRTFRITRPSGSDASPSEYENYHSGAFAGHEMDPYSAIVGLACDRPRLDDGAICKIDNRVVARQPLIRREKADVSQPSTCQWIGRVVAHNRHAPRLESVEIGLER